MPTVEITGITVSEVWDDESKTEIELNFGSFNDTGDYVSIKSDNDTIYIKRDTWSVLQEQIDGLFNEHEPSDN